MDSDDETIILTGTLIESETATVTFRRRTCHDDGIYIAVSVKLLEYVFDVETFFYGYNFNLFLREAEEAVSGQGKRAHLFNDDQTLVLEFINHDGTIFLSIDYSSVLPQPPDDDVLTALRSASRLVSAGCIGTRFSLTLMPLHNPLSELTDWLGGVLADHPVSAENP